MARGKPPETRKARAGIHDVAAAAGVSVVTVSRAFNAPDKVSARTRQKIDEAIRQIGYVPDLVARSLVSRRSRVIAACVPTFVLSDIPSCMQGLSDVITREGFQLLLGSTSYSAEQESAMVAAMLGRRPDGLVLTGTDHAPEVRTLLRQAGVPVVELLNARGTPVGMAVGIDKARAVQAMTAHLCRSGYRRIAFCSRSTTGNDRARARRQGYLAALKQARIRPDPDLLFEIDGSSTSGAEVVTKLTTRGTRVDAIVFTGDAPAVGAYLRCLALGLKVPGDIALAGLGNHELSRLIPGGLTTIGTDMYTLGRRAGELLCERLLTGRVATRSVDIGFELILRGSC
jgi:LacI family gluconate utilization system Gnt-I transcriptional repressor